MVETPKFIQGVYSFRGGGLERPVALAGADYSVPGDKRAQLTYLRAGNSSTELVYLVLHRDGKPTRYFPIGAKASIHVPLVIVEDLHPETRLELLVGAPEGVHGFVVVDMGLVEI
jgi:hypothetical protein